MQSPVPAAYRHEPLGFSWWIAAATLPLLAAAASMYAHVEPGQPFSFSATVNRGVVRDGLLYLAAAAIVVAPLAGVASVHRVRTGRWQHPSGSGVAVATSVRILLTVSLVVALSAVLTAAALGLQDEARLLLLSSHSTLAAVSLALAAFGALCGVSVTHPLDAAACSLLIVLAATAGVFVSGAWAFDVPRPLLQAAVAANPLVAIASASQIDVARMSVPYQMSALAHAQVTSPPWTTTCAWYGGVAGICLAGLGRAFQARAVAAALRGDRS